MRCARGGPELRRPWWGCPTSGAARMPRGADHAAPSSVITAHPWIKGARNSRLSTHPTTARPVTSQCVPCALRQSSLTRLQTQSTAGQAPHARPHSARRTTCPLATLSHGHRGASARTRCDRRCARRRGAASRCAARWHGPPAVRRDQVSTFHRCWPFAFSSEGTSSTLVSKPAGLLHASLSPGASLALSVRSKRAPGILGKRASAFASWVEKSRNGTELGESPKRT